VARESIAVFDIETNGLLPHVNQVWCIVIKEWPNGTAEQYGPDKLADALRRLESFDCLVGHNCIYFDFPVLRLIFGWEYKGRKVDTLVMSRTQRPNRTAPKGCTSGPHSVEAWGIRLKHKKVENEVWDHWHPLILHRCTEDVEIQSQILTALIKEGEGENWKNAHRLNSKLFHYLQIQEATGWTVDRDKLEHNMHMLDKWIRKIDEAVLPHLPIMCEVREVRTQEGEFTYVKTPFKKDGTYSVFTRRWFPDIDEDRRVAGPYSRVTFRYLSLDSSAELKGFLLDSGWEPAEWNYDAEGNRRSPKLSKEDEFIGVRGTLGRLIVKRVQCRQRRGVLEGWRNAIRDDGRISTPIRGITTTARLRHQAIVNVPSPDSGAFFAKQMRSIFVAQDGWTMVGCDSKGNQIRQLAARMGDDEFTHAVLYGSSSDGTDFHSLNQKRAGLPTRTLAKNFFYGFIFGAQDAKIAKIINGTKAQAKEIRENFFKEMPKLKELIDRCTEEWKATSQSWWDYKFNRLVQKDGYVTGIDGRPVLVDTEHKILNYLLQSDEAIQMAIAYVKVHLTMEKNGYKLVDDWNMLIWYHDEFQMECRPELAEFLGRTAAHAIKWAGEYLKIECPHDGDYKIGRSWYETH
jgi:DNA polymerase-1